MTEEPSVQPGDGPPLIGRVLSDRWFQALYDTPLLFSGILGADGAVLAANRLAVEGCGFARDDVIDRPFWECGWWSPDPAVADQVRRWCREAREHGAPMRMPSRYFVASGEERAVDLALYPVRDDSGVVTHIVATGNDVTDATLLQQDRHEREIRFARAAERTAADRLARLSRVALDLVNADTVEDLERIVVGRGLDILGADDGAVAVRDDPTGELRLARGVGPGDDVRLDHDRVPQASPLPAAYAARTGRPVMLMSRAEGLDWSPEMKRVYDATGHAAWAALPLRVGDRLLGALVMAWTDERHLNEDELALLHGFAAQCALALDRVQHLAAERAASRARQRLSEMLQRSLLTQPPTPDALEIAVRYVPAVEVAQVGGDWYDAFVTAAGATLLAVGDVSGHDQAAAASMGQVRNLLRGLAYDSDDGPARLVERLDSSLDGLGLSMLATAVVARVESPDDDTSSRRLRWSNAGHMPPLLRNAAGEVDVLERAPDMLLGLLSGTSRREHTVPLEVGSTLLLYTDGLVERRDRPLEDGFAQLAEALHRHGHLSVEVLCDQLLTMMTSGAPGDDDIALLVLRCNG